MNRIRIEGINIIHNSKVLVECAFDIDSSLALVGQSGSGKSLILKALLGLNDSGLEVKVSKKAPFEWVAGKSVAFVPQNPFTALSPLTKIADQMSLPYEQSVKIFSRLGLDAELLRRYPSELSGGQVQRVVMGMALSSKPSLLLLDEPTTALDRDSKKKLISLLIELQNEFSFSMLFVTHDMSVAKELCEDICVLKEGIIVEKGKMEAVLSVPAHPYTRQLIEADFNNREYRK